VIATLPTGVWLPWAGSLAFAASSVGYIAAVARGDVRPSRVTWGVWTVTAGIALGAAAAAGGQLAGLLVTAVTVLVPAAVVGATVVSPMGGVSAPGSALQRRIDRTCLVAAAATLLGWWGTSSPTAALVLITATDGIAAIPTVVRAWQGHERAGPYIGGMAGAGCALLSLTSWQLADWLFPVYVLTLSTALCVLVVARCPAGLRIRPTSTSNVHDSRAPARIGAYAFMDIGRGRWTNALTRADASRGRVPNARG
jgi:hypothetical protein